VKLSPAGCNPPALQAMLDRPSHAQPLANDAEALRTLLRNS